jgi:hypothetical protein
VRVSSENVGLARHREGLELVRIGRPVADDLLLPEEARRTLGDLQDGRGPGRTT